MIFAQKGPRVYPRVPREHIQVLPDLVCQPNVARVLPVIIARKDLRLQQHVPPVPIHLPLG